MTLDQLQNSFSHALATEDAQSIEKILKDFDLYCRNNVEAESNIERKKLLIQELIVIEQDWQSKLLQLKAKVRGKIADIRSNGKKINKYLTSF